MEQPNSRHSSTFVANQAALYAHYYMTVFNERRLKSSLNIVFVEFYPNKKQTSVLIAAYLQSIYSSFICLFSHRVKALERMSAASIN